MARQERATRTRELLVRAAAQVFAEAGYGHASLEDISRRAGVSRGALHFHFAAKQDLAQAVEDAAVAAVDELTAAVCGGAGRTWEELAEATGILIGRLAQDAVLRAGFALGADARWPGTALGQHWLQWVAGRLLRAEHEGLLAEGAPLDGAARTAAAAVVGCAVLGTGDPGWLSERWAKEFWDLMLSGLAPGPVRPGGGAGSQDAPRAGKAD